MFFYSLGEFCLTKSCRNRVIVRWYILSLEWRPEKSGRFFLSKTLVLAQIELLKYTIIIFIHAMLFCSQANGQSLFEPTSFHQLEFAHRGGYHGMSENTIETVAKNIRQGVKAIEVDVMMTKDSTLILFHDDTLGRVLQYTGNDVVGELTASEIRQHPFKARGAEGQQVSLFDDLVDTLIHMAVVEQRQFVLEVDFKVESDQAKLAASTLLRHIKETEAVYDTAIYEYFFVSSFYPSVLKELRNESKKVKLAYAMHAHYKGLAPKIGAKLARVIGKKNDVQILEANQCYLNTKRVNRWKNRGYLVHSFTSNKKFERDYVKNVLKVAMTTNCPLTIECPHDPSDEYVAKKWCKRCEKSFTRQSHNQTPF